MKLYVTMSSGAILLVRAAGPEEAAFITGQSLRLKEGKEISVNEVSNEGQPDVIWKFIPR